MWFEVYQSLAGGLFGTSTAATTQRWRWRLKGGNGEIMASGEGYSSREHAVRAVDTMKEKISSAEIRYI